MKYIIIVHEKKEITEVVKIIDGNFKVQKFQQSIYVQPKTKEDCYVLIEYCQELKDDFEEEDILIFSKLNSPMYGFVKYSDLSFLKIVLKIIVQHINCYIDNDYNTLLGGINFMKKWDKNPSWNWALDL